MTRSPDPPRKPRDDEIEVWGLTHEGLVRKENQDHFLVCLLRKQVHVILTNLPLADAVPEGGERLATLAMVADGVGGGTGGAHASRLAVAAITRYVTESIHAYYVADGTDDESFSGQLYAAALRVHADLLEAAEAQPDMDRMATTLTLFIGVWPYIYLLQVGDSRHYVLKDGKLHQSTRDQTIGQELIDSGAIPNAAAARARWGHVLSSSIGGDQSAPVVTRLDSDWNQVHLLCSDGLTEHVSDERIQERLLTMTSAKQACEDLLQDALDGGGTDNITILIGRAVEKPQ